MAILADINASTGVRHDDAAGGAARGAQPDPRRRGGWDGPRSNGRVEDAGLATRPRCTRVERSATRPGSARRGPPAPNSPHRRDHSDAVTNTSTSTTPATRKASGPVTTRPASRESTAPSYRPVNMSPVKTTVTELPESRVRVAGRGRPPRRSSAASQQAARELGRADCAMPGFRKGKVPPPVVIQRVGREAVLDEAVRAALGRWYVDAIDEAGHLAGRRARPRRRRPPRARASR